MRRLRQNIERLENWYSNLFVEPRLVAAVANPFGWDAIVVVCLFSEKGHRLRVSHHEYREESDE